MLGSARLLATGLLVMIAGAVSDQEHGWVVIAVGLALVTAAVLHSIELELLARVATAPPAPVCYAYGVQPDPRLAVDPREVPPPPPRGRRERITRERITRERAW